MVSLNCAGVYFVSLRHPLLLCILFSVAFHLFLAVCVQPFQAAKAGSGKTQSDHENVAAFVSASVNAPQSQSKSQQRRGGLVAAGSSGKSVMPIEAAIGNQSRLRWRALSPKLPAESETVFFKSSELSIRPRVLERFDPFYPSGIIEGLAGTVVLRLFISADGKVRKISIESSDLPETYQESARDSFITRNFSPGMIGDLAVGSQLLVEVAFD